MAGNNPSKRDQLPDTIGLKDEIVFQQMQRYGYDRAFTVPGSKLVFVGDENGCTAEALNAAIGANTAAVAYLIQVKRTFLQTIKGCGYYIPDQGNAVPLAKAVEIAHSHNLPLIADAAS